MLGLMECRWHIVHHPHPSCLERVPFESPSESTVNGRVFANHRLDFGGVKSKKAIVAARWVPDRQHLSAFLRKLQYATPATTKTLCRQPTTNFGGMFVSCCISRSSGITRQSCTLWTKNIRGHRCHFAASYSKNLVTPWPTQSGPASDAHLAFYLKRSNPEQRQRA